MDATGATSVNPAVFEFPLAFFQTIMYYKDKLHDWRKAGGPKYGILPQGYLQGVQNRKVPTAWANASMIAFA